MRQEGSIVRWDDGKGFGFIRGGASGQDVFVHVRDFRTRGGEVPRQGLRVSFEEVHVGGKGPRAMDVRPVTDAAAAGRPRAGGNRAAPPVRERAARARPPRRQDTAPASGAGWILPLMLAYGLGLAWLAWQRLLPWWILPASLLLNLCTFFAYWQDKDAAQRRRWRIKEDTLHLWSLAGGWGGAWFAQQVLRHKSAKASFRAVYVATVLLHCAGVVGLWWLRTKA